MLNSNISGGHYVAEGANWWLLHPILWYKIIFNPLALWCRVLTYNKTMRKLVGNCKSQVTCKQASIQVCDCCHKRLPKGVREVQWASERMYKDAWWYEGFISWLQQREKMPNAISKQNVGRMWVLGNEACIGVGWEYIDCGRRRAFRTHTFATRLVKMSGSLIWKDGGLGRGRQQNRSWRSRRKSVHAW